MDSLKVAAYNLKRQGLAFDIGKHFKLLYQDSLFQKLIKNLKWVALGVVGLAATVAGGVSLSGILGDVKVARQIVDDVSAITALKQALRDVGQPAEDAADILGGLVQTLGRGVTGDRGIRDTFSRIGLSVHELNALKPSEALARIANAVSAIPDPTKRAAIATQLFGDKAQAILPILTQGAGALSAAAGKANAFGNSLNNIDATNLESAKIQLENYKVLLSGIVVQVGAQLLPMLIAVGQELVAIAPAGMTVASSIKTAIYYVGTFVAIINEVGKVFKIFFKFVAVGWLSLAQAIGKAINAIIKGLSHLPDELGGDFFKKVGTDADELLGKVGADVKELTTEIDANIASIGDSFERFGAFMANAEARAGDLAAAANKVRDADGAVRNAFKFGDQFREGLNVINTARTPLQKFQDEVISMNAMLKSGAIGWETYTRSVANAINELEKAHELQSLALPSAQLARTSGAVSAVSKAEQQERRQLEKPEDRVRRVLEQSQKIESEQLKIQQSIAKAIGTQNVVKF